MAGLAELLKGFRSAAGLTQEQLAERSGLSVGAVATLETGRRRHPWTSTLSQLAAALELTPEQRRQLEDLARRSPKGAGPTDGLPADLADFVGRQELVAELVSSLTADQSPVVAPVSISGMGGIGKTALAVRVARQVAPAFPDGTFFVNLRGHGGGEPTSSLDALAQLLQALGAAGESIPGELAAASARFRSAVAGRRVLIVLDDAADSDQIEPLLPGTAGSAVLVTSRPWLLDLPGARHVALDLFEEKQAVDLLRSIGVSEVGSDPESAAQVARHCGLLPLALRIAGGHLADHPDRSLAELAETLADERRRLELLSTEDAGVRTAIRLSVDALAGDDRSLRRDAAEALPLISLIEGDEFSLRIAAAATARPEDEVESALELLVDVSLLETPAPRRYRLHDLVRAYGREQSVAVAEEVRLRVLDQYVALIWRVNLLRNPSGMTDGWRDPRWTRPAEDLDYDQAMELIDAERSGLVRTIRAAGRGSAEERRRTVWAAVGFDEVGLVRRRWSEWRDINTVAAAQVDENEDLLGAAMVCYDLGLALNELGDFEAGSRELTRVLGLVRRLGDRKFENQCLIQLSHALEQSGALERAEALAREALQLTLEAADERMESWCHLLLGMVAGRKREYAVQDAEFDLAIQQLDRAPDERPSTLAMRRLSIGESYLASGRYDRAEPMLRDSLRLYETAEQAAGRAEAMDDLSAVLTEVGRPAEALELQEKALRLAAANDSWDREASVRLRRGKTLVALGRLPEARQEWERAAALYRAHVAPGIEEAERLLAGPPR